MTDIYPFIQLFEDEKLFIAIYWFSFSIELLEDGYTVEE